MSKKLSIALEAYLENIAELEKENGLVRTSDLAKKMNCRLPSVTNALKRLSELGLISYKSYHPVSLTHKGIATIKKLEEYHQVLAVFLQDILGFNEEFSQSEACKLEHLIDPIILKRIRKYSLFVKDNQNFQQQKKDFKKLLD